VRVRLFLAFALVVIVSILSFLLITRQGTATEVRTFIARGGMMGMDSVATDLEAYYQQNGSWQGVEVVLQNARPGRGMGGMMGSNGMLNSSGPWLRVADAQGNYLADNRSAPDGKMTANERAAAIALHDAQGGIAGYLVAAGGSAAYSEQDLLNRLVQAGWIAAGISGTLALLLALLLSYRLLRPVQDLTHAAARLARGDLSQRVQIHTRDEVGVLGESFNHMAESLERAEQNRQAMTADIAHELRTPIAIQRAHLEALQDGVYPMTVENLQPVLEQTELLTRLVEDLRTLALADAGALKLERGPTDLSDLVRRVVERFRPEAERREDRLDLQITEDPALGSVSVDSVRIEQIINNLISNALRYTPDGGAIRVSLRREANWATLRVEDTGPGIPEEAMPRLFERFYRVDKSRSREAGGTGLGLAIARQLALAHGGDLTAENLKEGGAAFSLKLPY
jgi:signal transduction histidine kinase